MTAADPNPSTTQESEAALIVRRRRLKFRSWHRGTREADLLIGGFADAHLDGYDGADLDAFEAILGRSDPDIYNWISGREAAPAELDGPVLRAMMAFRLPRQHD